MAIIKNILYVSSRQTVENVSRKSKPSIWLNPWTTQRLLNLYSSLEELLLKFPKVPLGKAENIEGKTFTYFIPICRLNMMKI